MLLSNLNLLAQAPNGVARLRELILTLAVQGKLVPQDPSDEPASELLKKIRAEKDRLIAEGKIKRDKPLAEIGDQEKPFALPVGWEWVRLQHIGYTQTGTTPDKKNPQMYGDGIPFIKPGDIYPNHVDYDNEALSQEGLNDSGRIAPAGSLLMVCIGTIGKSNLISRDCSFNQQINSVTPLCCLPEYVKLYCRCPYFQGEVWARSSSTTIAILNKGKWEAIPFALPPLAEQSRIVTRVEELMRLCDALEAKGQLEATQHAQLVSTLLATLTQSETPAQLADNWHRIATHFDLLLDRPQAVDALEQTILQLAVRGLLVPQDPQDTSASQLLEEISEKKSALVAAKLLKIGQLTEDSKSIKDRITIPEAWAWAKGVELLFITKLAGFEYTKHFALQDNGDVPVVRAQNVRPFTLSTTSLKYIDGKTSQVLDRCALTKNALLVTFIGAGIGDVALFDKAERWHLAPNVAKMEPFSGCEDLLDLRYLNYFLNSSYGRQEIFKHIQSTAQPSISMGTIRDIDFPIPPLAEQSRIVTRVAQLRRLCADLRQRLSVSQSTQAHLAEALVQEVA